MRLLHNTDRGALQQGQVLGISLYQEYIKRERGVSNSRIANVECMWKVT